MPEPIPQPPLGRPNYGSDIWNKPVLWLLAGGFVLFAVIAIAVYFGTREMSEAERKAEILRSLSAPSDAPRVSAEEKARILNSLSAPPNATQVSAEEKQRILESLRR